MCGYSCGSDTPRYLAPHVLRASIWEVFCRLPDSWEESLNIFCGYWFFAFPTYDDYDGNDAAVNIVVVIKVLLRVSASYLVNHLASGEEKFKSFGRGYGAWKRASILGPETLIRSCWLQRDGQQIGPISDPICHDDLLSVHLFHSNRVHSSRQIVSPYTYHWALSLTNRYHYLYRSEIPAVCNSSPFTWSPKEYRIKQT